MAKRKSTKGQTFVPFGKVENVMVATMTWLTAMEYLCHR
jgi:hypothetical protein